MLTARREYGELIEFQTCSPKAMSMAPERGHVLLEAGFARSDFQCKAGELVCVSTRSA